MKPRHALAALAITLTAIAGGCWRTDTFTPPNLCENRIRPASCDRHGTHAPVTSPSTLPPAVTP